MLNDSCLHNDNYGAVGKGGGDLNYEVEARCLTVTPPPLFFLEVGRKRGGGVA